MKFMILLVHFCQGKFHVDVPIKMGGKNVPMDVSGTAVVVQLTSDYSPLEQSRRICLDLPERVVTEGGSAARCTVDIEPAHGCSCRLLMITFLEPFAVVE